MILKQYTYLALRSHFATLHHFGAKSHLATNYHIISEFGHKRPFNNCSQKCRCFRIFLTGILDLSIKKDSHQSVTGILTKFRHKWFLISKRWNSGWKCQVQMLTLKAMKPVSGHNIIIL